MFKHCLNFPESNTFHAPPPLFPDFKSKNEKIPIGKFIKSAVSKRLEMNQEFIKTGRWSEALALMGKPQVKLFCLFKIKNLKY